MIDATSSLGAAEGLGGADLAAYLISKGWNMRPSKVAGISVLSKELSETALSAEIVLPIQPGFNDEHRRVADALRTLAQIEGQSEDDVSSEIRRFVVTKAASAPKLEVIGVSNHPHAAGTPKSKFDPSEIESVALQFREALGVFDQPVFNIVALLENEFRRLVPNFRLAILEKNQMPNLEVYSQTKPIPCMFMRKEFYARAVRNEPLSRYVLAHELGHLLLHHQSPARERGTTPPKQSESGYQSLEAEARLFAGALLMPRFLMSSINDAPSLSRRFHVSVEAAESRIKSIQKEKASSGLQDLLKGLTQSELK